MGAPHFFFNSLPRCCVSPYLGVGQSVEHHASQQRLQAQRESFGLLRRPGRPRQDGEGLGLEEEAQELPAHAELDAPGQQGLPRAPGHRAIGQGQGQAQEGRDRRRGRGGRAAAVPAQLPRLGQGQEEGVPARHRRLSLPPPAEEGQGHRQGRLRPSLSLSLSTNRHVLLLTKPGSDWVPNIHRSA